MDGEGVPVPRSLCPGVPEEAPRGLGGWGRESLPATTGEGDAHAPARRARPWRRSCTGTPLCPPLRWFRPRSSRLPANGSWRGGVMDVRADP